MIVLDTHTLWWWAADPGRLSRKAREAIEGAQWLGVPTIAFWELAMLIRRGRLSLATPVRQWTEKVLAVPRVEALDLSASVAVLADSLNMHADPADRFIVATAMSLEAPLLTKDKLLAPLPFVQTLW